MWVKVDDKLHNHHKTRRTLGSGDKRRDAAPMGLWILAASWAGQNGTSGWVPNDELDRWDDDWEALAQRLVDAGYWWPEVSHGDPGHGFVNWEQYNPSAGSSDSGLYGNHKRWHLDRGIVSPDCSLCPQESPDDRGESGGDDARSIGGRSGGDIVPDSGGDIGGESDFIALPEPEPDPEPDPNPSCASDDARCATRDAQCADGAQVDAQPDAQPADDDFEQWWNLYDRKVDRKRAEAKWRLALKKRGITANLLMDATRRYIDHQRAIGKHPEFTKHPATWLNGECWNDDLVAPAAGGAYDDLGNPIPLPRDEWPAEWRTQ